jgi:hypothetical protein
MISSLTDRSSRPLGGTARRSIKCSPLSIDLTRSTKEALRLDEDGDASNNGQADDQHGKCQANSSENGKPYRLWRTRPGDFCCFQESEIDWMTRAKSSAA